jgi:hypothetical protein
LVSDRKRPQAADGDRQKPAKSSQSDVARKYGGIQAALGTPPRADTRQS